MSEEQDWRRQQIHPGMPLPYQIYIDLNERINVSGLVRQQIRRTAREVDGISVEEDIGEFIAEKYGKRVTANIVLQDYEKLDDLISDIENHERQSQRA